MSKYDVILVANSTGELSALVKPVAETLFENSKEIRIILVLTPCQYTSGKELEYIQTIQGISEIITANDYKNWILLNQKPKIEFNEKGVVFYLGGDLAHAVLVAKKTHYPALAYVQDWIGWTGFYKKFLVPDEQCYRKLGKNKKARAKLKIIGNLMVDSIKDMKKWSPHKNVITFLPGSRVWQIKHTTPIYEEIMRQINIRLPEVSFQLVSSPFQKATQIPDMKLIKFEDTHNSDLIITIPGTNTARLAALGIPMLVIFPLDNPDVIPLEGLPHFIGKIPYLGSKFKKKLAAIVNKRTRFFALPNIKADTEIIQEIRGIIKPAEVARTAVGLLKDKSKRERMSQELRLAMGQPGAAQKIMGEINEVIRQTF